MKLLTLVLPLFSLTAFASENNIHFVHGANLTAKSWDLVRSKVKFKSSAIDLPGRNDGLEHKKINLTNSAVALCGALRGHDVVIVHSQGGAIINHALGLCPEKKVEKIIYISAVVPLSGEKPFSKLSAKDEEYYFKGITYNKKLGSMVISSTDKFLSTFAPEASPKIRKLIMINSVSEPSAIGDEKVKYKESDKSKISTYYIKTLKDKIISPKSQNKMIKDADIKNIYEINGGHLPMFTNVDELSVILNKIIDN